MEPAGREPDLAFGARNKGSYIEQVWAYLLRGSFVQKDDTVPSGIEIQGAVRVCSHVLYGGDDSSSAAALGKQRKVDPIKPV